jgi:hypothetical protein
MMDRWKEACSISKELQINLKYEISSYACFLSINEKPYLINYRTLPDNSDKALP